mmetsp:Transcript_7490/g.25763  ORF Transcript_7490/g.25763 Transcript_7490/m.25763 type:complete len:279 (+) Transcript_7490:1140-1976(+)
MIALQDAPPSLAYGKKPPMPPSIFPMAPVPSKIFPPPSSSISQSARRNSPSSLWPVNFIPSPCRTAECAPSVPTRCRASTVNSRPPARSLHSTNPSLVLEKPTSSVPYSTLPPRLFRLSSRIFSVRDWGRIRMPGNGDSPGRESSLILSSCLQPLPAKTVLEARDLPSERARAATPRSWKISRLFNCTASALLCSEGPSAASTTRTLILPAPAPLLTSSLARRRPEGPAPATRTSTTTFVSSSADISRSPSRVLPVSPRNEAMILRRPRPALNTLFFS